MENTNSLRAAVSCGTLASASLAIGKRRLGSVLPGTAVGRPHSLLRTHCCRRECTLSQHLGHWRRLAGVSIYLGQVVQCTRACALTAGSSPPSIGSASVAGFWTLGVAILTRARTVRRDIARESRGIHVVVKGELPLSFRRCTTSHDAALAATRDRAHY